MVMSRKFLWDFRKIPKISRKNLRTWPYKVWGRGGGANEREGVFLHGTPVSLKCEYIISTWGTWPNIYISYTKINLTLPLVPYPTFSLSIRLRILAPRVVPASRGLTLFPARIDPRSYPAQLRPLPQADPCSLPGERGSLCQASPVRARGTAPPAPTDADNNSRSTPTTNKNAFQ